jgi:hypothetical protein
MFANHLLTIPEQFRDIAQGNSGPLQQDASERVPKTMWSWLVLPRAAEVP